MMTITQQREQLVNWIGEAVTAGARRGQACSVVGLGVRTLQRWQPKGTDQVLADRRPDAQRPEPVNKLSAAERREILNLCNQPAYASLPPSQIVPKLADAGQYLASESSFYRILKAEGQLHHRGRSQSPRPARSPTTHIARAPNQVWTWDISYLPSRVQGRFFYLYMVEDLYSRYGVAWEVHESESGEHAAELLEKALLRERLHDRKPVLHSDNGSPMKSLTLRTKLVALGAPCVRLVVVSNF
ncbi:MAG: DDE-type integrase/transposase/recombinase [Methylococcales bacterium]|nr:DDE-type integrase/transposase/recombinase [Methylococcales bacterium]